GECTDRYKAIFALGPVAAPTQYGGDSLYCNPSDQQEVALRSPILWLHCVKSPMYIFEGGQQGNWSSIQQMVAANTNPKIQFFKIPGQTHFSVIAPLTEKLAGQISMGRLDINEQTLK